MKYRPTIDTGHIFALVCLRYLRDSLDLKYNRSAALDSTVLVFHLLGSVVPVFACA